jgi:hypothetical protein
MPYKRVGNRIYVKKNGKWMPKANEESIDKAKKTIQKLRGIEFGIIKPSK